MSTKQFTKKQLERIEDARQGNLFYNIPIPLTPRELPRRLEIKLSQGEIERVKEYARRVQDLSEGNYQTSFKLKEPYRVRLYASFIGGFGELSWCKAFDKRWEARIGNYRGPDIGKRIQIRARTKLDHELKIKPTDYADHAYFLVIVMPPNVAYILGWRWGYEREQFPLLNLQTKGQAKRNAPAYFIPQDKLFPPQSIPRELLDECSGTYRPA